MNIRAVPGWMCEIDFDYELGEAAGGTRIFASEENLNLCRKCAKLDHKSVEVVTLTKEDFLQLLKKSNVNMNNIRKSNIGEIIYQKVLDKHE